MIPLELGENEVAIHEAASWYTLHFDEVLNAAMLCYSDGTRGVSEVPMLIRPAAFGAATFRSCNDKGNPHFYDIECLGGGGPW